LDLTTDVLAGEISLTRRPSRIGNASYFGLRTTMRGSPKQASSNLLASLSSRDIIN